MLNRKRVLYGDGSPATNSEIMSDKAGNKHRKMGVTSVNGVSPVQRDVEVVEIAGSDEENDIVGGGGATGRSQLPPSHSGGQRNIHAFLKAEVAKLCKALKLSEDVVHLIQILLEYLVENYDVKKGGIRHIQAFQMSLCWIATEILGRKIDRKGSLLEAKEILNFECPGDLANSVYEKLTSLKETFQQLHGKTSDASSSRNVASPLADIAVGSSNLQEPCMKAEVIEILDQEENQESRDKIGIVENQRKLRKTQKCCEIKKWSRRRKHEKKVQEFNKLWKEKREKLVEEHTAELAVFSAIHSPSATKMDKFIEENSRFCAALQDLECSMEWERRALEKKHAAEMDEVNRKCEKWLAKAEANYGSGGSTMINDANAHELESRNDNQVSKNSGSNSSAPLIIIASDAVVLDLSANVEIEVVGCGFPTDNEPVGMQVAIPLSDEQPDADNVSLQNPKDFAAAKVDSNGPIVIEIPSTYKDTEMDSVILGSHGDPLPDNVIVNEIPSTNGDTKGDSVCRGGSLPVDAPSTAGKDMADCLKPVDLQTANATDNGPTEEHSVPCPNTVVSHHEHGDSAGFHNQPVALNEGHTMLHVSDDCRSRTDLQEASVSESQVDRELSDTHVNIADSADCNSRPDSHTAEEPDKILAGEQSAGAQVDRELSDTHVNIADSADCNSRPDSHTAEEPDKICAGEQSAGAQVDRELSDTHVNIADSADCNSHPDSHTAEEPDKIRAGEQSGGAQAQNLVSPTQVDEDAGELNKQPVLENGEDSMLLSSDNAIDTVESHDQPNLPTVCGTGVEVNEPLDSSQNHTLSDVAGDTAELLQNAAVLPNSSSIVSAETSSRAHPDLPHVSGIDHEPIGEQFVGFLNPESISEVAANAVLPLPPHPHFAWLTNQWLIAEPLQREFIKRCNEMEQFNKLHEETKSQLNAACEKEIQEMYAQMRDKYTKKLRDAESSFTVKKTEIEAKLNMLVTNRFLANAFRSKCRYFISSGSSDVVQPGAPSGHLQQQQFVSSSQSSLRESPIASSSTVNPVASSGFMQQQQLLSSQPSLRQSLVVASSSSLSQPASVNPVYPVQGYPIASLSSPQPPIIQQTNTPSAQFTPRSTNPSLTHSRPLQISTVTPNIGNTRVGGSNVRAPAPHLQPFRPPPSPVQPMTTSPTASQPVRLGTNQNALNRCRTSECQNDGQPGPPRNNYSFSAVELPRTVANVDDLIHIDADEEEELEHTPMDSERTLSVIPEGGEVSAQKETEERVADSGDASQEKDAAVDTSVQILPSIAENITSPTDPVSALAAVPLRTVSQKSKKRHRPASSRTSASDSSFGFEDMSADDFADTCYHFGKALHKKTSSMAKDISDLQQKVRHLDEANAKVASLESSEAVARQEIDQLKADLAMAEGLLFTQEEQLKLRDEQLRQMREENQQHLAVAKKMKADFEETIRQMEETPAQNVVQKVISGYKAALETLEEIQVILAPALRRGYTLGVDEAKPADLVISTLPNHKLYDKKAGEVFTKRYDEYKSGEDIVRKYAKKKSSQPSVQPSTITSAQPSEKSAQPSETSAQTSAPPAS